MWVVEYKDGFGKWRRSPTLHKEFGDREEAQSEILRMFGQNDPYRIREVESEPVDYTTSLGKAQTKVAIQNADHKLKAVALPTYTELAEALRTLLLAHRDRSAAVAIRDRLHNRI